MAVPSSQILSFGPEVRDYQDGINVVRLRKERTEHTQARMKKEGVAAAILAGPDFRYTTGLRTPMFIGHGAEQFAVVFADPTKPLSSSSLSTPSRTADLLPGSSLRIFALSRF